jgi:hypothetical protein
MKCLQMMNETILPAVNSPAEELHVSPEYQLALAPYRLCENSSSLCSQCRMRPLHELGDGMLQLKHVHSGFGEFRAIVIIDIDP